MKWIGKHSVFSDLLIGGVLLTPPDNQYSYELTLPNDDGASGQVLSTDGNGVLSWVANGVAVPNALTAGTGFDFSSGAGSWDGSIAETINIDWTEFGNISIGATDNSSLYIRRSPNSSAAAGGDFELRGGNSGSGTNLAAGNVELHTGLGTGSGTAGLIRFWAGMNTTSGTNSHTGVVNSYMASTTTQNTFTINEPGATNDDTLEFKVAANGESTITTIDAATSAAHLTFDIDGHIYNDSASGRYYFYKDGNTDDFLMMMIGTNGDLSLTTTDAAATAANIIIEADGTAELAGTTVTLDSVANIELEVGAATNYVQTTGIFRGHNVGSISDDFIPLMPIDFAVADSFRQYGNMGLNGHFMQPSSDRQTYFAQKIIPRGYTASSVAVTGLDANGNATYRCFVGDITGTTPAAVSAATALNSVATFTANIVGDGLKYCTIVYDPGETADVIYGGKINIAKT